MFKRKDLISQVIEKCRKDRNWCDRYRQFLEKKLGRIEVIFYSWFGIQGLLLILEVLRYVVKELSISILLIFIIVWLYIWYERRKLIKLIDKLYLEGDPIMDDSWGWLLAMITLTVGGILIAIFLL